MGFRQAVEYLVGTLELRCHDQDLVVFDCCSTHDGRREKDDIHFRARLSVSVAVPATVPVPAADQAVDMLIHLTSFLSKALEITRTLNTIS